MLSPLFWIPQMLQFISGYLCGTTFTEWATAMHHTKSHDYSLLGAFGNQVLNFVYDAIPRLQILILTSEFGPQTFRMDFPVLKVDD